MSLEERTCKFCNENTIEDELHFLTGCARYDQLRNCLYDNIEKEFKNFGLASEQKFTLEMSSKNLKLANHLAIFIKIAGLRSINS